MSTTYKVRVWDLQKRYRSGDKDRKVPSRYVVRWSVNRRQFQESFKNKAQADSFRADLVSAVRSGEAFDIDKGLPLLQLRLDDEAMSWYDFAGTYSAIRWEELAPGSRRQLGQ
jgi:hypothetical protein